MLSRFRQSMAMAATLAGGLFLASAALADSGTPDHARSEPKEDIPALVRQLGAPRFVDRQRASQRLLKTGIAAESALQAAAAGADAEIRDRAARILQQISVADFESRLEAFAADVEGKQQHRLPAWDQFSKHFGADETARGLFVEMLRAEPEMLQLLDTNSPEIADTFSRRCEELTTGPEAFNPDGKTGPTVGSVATVMFVGISPDLKIEEQAGLQVFNLIQPMLQSGARRGPWGPLLRQMTVQWIQRESGPAIAFQNLWLAFNFDLPVGLQVAERILKAQPITVDVAPFAVLVVARFGNLEHLPLLEPLLKDTTSVLNDESAGENMETQMRDVALAALVHLTGQELKDYGFDKTLAGQAIVFQPGKYGFGSAAKRTKAHQKWSDWKAAHIQSDKAAKNPSSG